MKNLKCEVCGSKLIKSGQSGQQELYICLTCCPVKSNTNKEEVDIHNSKLSSTYLHIIEVRPDENCEKKNKIK